MAVGQLRGYLLRHGYTAFDLLDTGPTGNVSIDYSRMPDVAAIPRVTIDPRAIGRQE